MKEDKYIKCVGYPRSFLSITVVNKGNMIMPL